MCNLKARGKVEPGMTFITSSAESKAYTEKDFRLVLLESRTRKKKKKKKRGRTQEEEKGKKVRPTAKALVNTDLDQLDQRETVINTPQNNEDEAIILSSPYAGLA